MEHSRKGEVTMSERDYLAKEEALRRLSEPEGDHELHTALERMRLDHPHLWGVLHRLHLAHDADPSKLEEWRRAPEGSREDALAAHYDEAMRVLQMSLQ
jgi:hypothetical protein